MKRTEDSANSSAGRRGRGTPSKRPGWLALPCSRSISFGGYVSRLPLTTHPPTHPTDHAHESKQQPSVAYARATPAPARHRAKKGKETISASVPARPQCGALTAECRPRAYKIRSTRPSDSPPTQAEEHTHTHTATPPPLLSRCRPRQRRGTVGCSRFPARALARRTTCAGLAMAAKVNQSPQNSRSIRRASAARGFNN